MATARKTAGVASAAPVGASGRPGGEPLVVDGRVRVDVTLSTTADSDAAKDTVARLRTALHAAPGAEALVGGYTAQQYDTLRTAERDRTLIGPVVLAIIFLILTVLLRSLLMPALLVATVALNFLATLGVSSLVFRHALGFTGTDPSVPLYGFVFLVALGVDYNNLPDVPGPRGVPAAWRARGRPARPGHHGRRHHLGRRGPRGHLRRARRDPAGLPRTDRLHGRLRRAPRHARGALAAGARPRAGHRATGVVAGTAQPRRCPGR